MTNLAKTTEPVTMAMITTHVAAEDISKDETVKVVLKYYFSFRVYILHKRLFSNDLTINLNLLLLLPLF